MRPTTRDLKGGGRVIRGNVSSVGSIAAGSGFTVVRTGVGIYVITFLTPFSAPPIVSANTLATNLTRFAGLTGATPYLVQVNVIDTTQTPQDVAFSFVATEQER